MDGNVDALKQWAKQTLETQKPAQKDNPDARLKIRNAAKLAKQYGYDIPDDVADDFYELVKLESGRAHYLADGKTVKTGVKTPNGDFAIGFSQVMGNTANPYKAKNLDPYKEDDNIIIGLNEFYKGGRDSVARRLAYVGGANTDPKRGKVNQALATYQRTGEIPDTKLYSYLPKNRETYKTYVENSGGFKPLQNWANNQLTNKPPNANNLLEWANQTLQAETPSVNQSDVNNSALTNLEQSKTELTAQFKASKNAAERRQIKESILKVNKSIADLKTNQPQINRVITPTVEEIKTEQGAFVPNSVLNPQEQSDVNLLTQDRELGKNYYQSDFSKSLKPDQFNQQVELRKRYDDYVKQTGKQDNEQTQQEFFQTIQPAPQTPKPSVLPPNKSAIPQINAKPAILNQSQDSPEIPAELMPNYQEFLGAKGSQDTSEARREYRQIVNLTTSNAQKENETAQTQNPRTISPTAPIPNDAVTFETPETLKNFTNPKDALFSTVASAKVDLSKKPKGMSLREYLFRASFTPAAQKYGINIDEAMQKLIANGRIFQTNDEVLAGMNDKETADFIKRKGNIYTVSYNRAFVNDLLGGNNDNIAPALKQEFDTLQSESSFQNASKTDPLAFDDKTTDNLQRSFRTSDYRAELADIREYETPLKNRFNPSDEELRKQVEYDMREDAKSFWNLSGRTPTQTEIDDEFTERKKYALKLSDKLDALRAGQKLNQEGGFINSLYSGQVGNVAKFGSFFGGITRPLAALGFEAPYRGFREMTEAARIEKTAADEGKGNWWKLAGTVSGLTYDIPMLVAGSKGIGALGKTVGFVKTGDALGNVIFFGTQAGLESAGRGEGKGQILAQTVKGASIGALFEGASKLSSFVGKTAFTNELTATEAAKMANLTRSEINAMKLSGEIPQSVKNAWIAGKVLGETVRIGTIAGGTRTIEKAFGTSDDDANNAAIVNVVFDTVMRHGGKLGTVAGKVFRYWKDGKFTDFYVDAKGAINKLKDPTPDKFVDVEIVSEKDLMSFGKSETAKTVSPEIKTANENAGFKSSEQVKPEVKTPENFDNVIDLKPINRTEPVKETTANRGNLLPNSQEPFALAEKNPMRAESANPETVKALETDQRAQKIFDVLQDGQPQTVEGLAKATRFKTDNIRDSIMNLYDARKIEILPDNSVRLISTEPIKAKTQNLYELAQTKKNQEPIKLGESSLSAEEKGQIQAQNQRIENIPAPTSGSQQNLVNSAQPTIEQQTAERYEQLPEQKPQTEKVEKPKAKVIYAERPNIAEKLNTVKTERGTTAKVEPKVIDASDLITSLEDGYPPEFQPRQRDTRQASKAQIADIANKLEPSFLDDSPKASDGRPLVVPVEWQGKTKYAVISGNGRTEGIKTAYALENEPSRKYAEFARGKSAESASLRQPVYVGILDPNEIDLTNFAKEANESATAKMSATEQAKSDAGYLDSGLLKNFYVADDGNINIAPNRDFIRGFMESVAPSEQNALMMPDGSLSQEGVNRVRNAIFAKAFGQSDKGLNAIQRLAESTDDNIKRITNAMLAKAGSFASLKQAVEDGKRYTEFDITDDLATAMEKLSSLRDSATSISDYIQQGNLFGAETTPFQTRIMQVFDNHKRSSKAIKTILDDFLKVAEAAGDPSQAGLFGESATIDPKATFEAAVKNYEDEQRRIAEGQQGFGFTDENQGLRSGRGTDTESSGLFEGQPERTDNRSRQLKIVTHDTIKVGTHVQGAVTSGQVVDMKTDNDFTPLIKVRSFGNWENEDNTWQSAKGFAPTEQSEATLEDLTSFAKQDFDKYLSRLSGDNVFRNRLKELGKGSEIQFWEEVNGQKAPEKQQVNRWETQTEKPTDNVETPLFSYTSDSLTPSENSLFYSQLEKTIADKMPNRATVAQVQNILANPSNSLKKEEIEWLGINEWLTRTDAPYVVTKAEVLDFIKENQPQITVKTISDGKWRKYQAPGAKSDEKEILLTLPERKSYPTFSAHQIGNTGTWIVVNDITGETLREFREEEDLPSAEKRAKRRAKTENQGAKEGVSDSSLNYQSDHYGEKNVLLHIRFNERIAEGKKTLFIEELQSDYLQAARKKGFADLEKPYVVFDTFSGAEIDRFRTRNEAREKTNENSAWDFDNELNPAMDENKKLPPAPFLKSWHELGFKVALKYAAENDFDQIAWTSGKQQLDRFPHLVKAVDQVSFFKTTNSEGNAGFFISLLYKGAEKPHSSFVQTPEEIEKFVGDSDIAEQIIKNGEQGTINPPNLKIGGSGMKAFYDGIVPMFANKYVRKWKTRVGTANLDKRFYKDLRLGKDDGKPAIIGTDTTSGEKVILKTFDNAAQAKFALDVAKNISPFEQVQSVTITPEMKESVLNVGQPLFTKKHFAPSIKKELDQVVKTDYSLSEDLLPKAKITKTGDGEAVVNKEAYRIVYDAFLDAFPKFTGKPFAGAFLNPYQVVKTKQSLEKILNQFGKDLPKLSQLRAKKFLMNFNRLIDTDGTLIINYGNEEYPQGATAVRQEERAHRADYRVGVKHSVGREVMMKTLGGKRAIINLGKGEYKGTSVETRAVEATAKLFVEDGRKETGLSELETAKLQIAYVKKLLENKSAKEIKEAFQDVSPIGKKAGEYAERRENKLRRTGATQEPLEPARAEELSTARGSGRETRRREGRTGFFDSPTESANIGSGLLESTGNQSLVPFQSKSTWGDDFPDGVRHTSIAALKAHPKFKDAKAGDTMAAIRLVSDLVKDDRVKQLAEQFPDAIVVPIREKEETGFNKIPSAYASLLAAHDLELDSNIVSISSISRKSKNAVARLLARKEFDGDVKRGRKYLIVDDVFTLGGSVRALKEYIESKGGKVVGVSALAFSAGDSKIAVQSKTIAELKKRFDYGKLNEFINQADIAESVESLTEREANTILRFRSFEAFRNRVDAERLLNERGGNAETLQTIDDVLFSIPPDDEMPSDAELTQEIESNSRKILKFIYDGKRDVTIPEAVVNLTRAGLLLSVKVVKNNAVSNTLMQASELGAKPFMTVADRLNPRSKGRTVAGISPTAVFEGLFGKQGALREGLGLDRNKGMLGGLIYGVSEQEALRFELATDKEPDNPQFVRSTGVPLLDVIIEAAKRISAAGDRPFKAFSRTQELRSLAKTFAKNEYKDGLNDDWKARMRELKADPTPLMLEMIKDYSEITTFQNTNYGLEAFDKVRKALIADKQLAKLVPNEAQRKAARIVLGAAYIGLGQIAPFVRTPVNVGIRSLEYFPPIGAVKAAWQFFQIGKSSGRKAWLEDVAAKRNAKITRLERIREHQDKKFKEETDKYVKGFEKKYKARNEQFDADIKKASLVTDKYRQNHEKMLAEKRKKLWNDKWETEFEKYQTSRQRKRDKMDGDRKNTDDAIQRRWADENAAADLGFTMHESRRFAEAGGRAMFGSFVGGLLLLAVAYAAFDAVGTTGDDEDDKSKAKYKAGIPDDSIKIGKYRFKFSNNPFGYALKMGINLLEQFSRPGTNTEKITAGGKRFAFDLLESNPFTDGATGKFEHKDLLSDLGGRLSAPIPRVLGEIGEVIDNKPRSYWDKGFGAQFLIKLPYTREFLPESESYLGGIEERGDGWRRFLRLVDPVGTVKEKAPQSALPNTPLSKYSEPGALKDKLKSATTDDTIKYYEQFKERMKPEEVKELRKLLKTKADNANELGTLTDEEKQKIQRVFPDLKLKELMPKLPSMKRLPSQFDEEK